MHLRSPRIFAGLFSVVMVTSVIAQDAANESPSDQPSVRTERLVVAINHLPADVLRSVVLELYRGTPNFNIISENSTNKLVIEATDDDLSGALGLVRELDRPRAVVTLRVLEVILDPSQPEDVLKSASTSKVEQTIKELGDSVRVVNRLLLSTIDNQPVTTTSGTRAPIATSQMVPGGRGGGRAQSFSFQEFGTTLTATPRVSSGHLMLDLRFEKSEIVVAEEDSGAPASTVTTSFQSTLAIPNGESVVVGGMRMGADHKPVYWRLIVSATVQPAGI